LACWSISSVERTKVWLYNICYYPFYFILMYWYRIQLASSEFFNPHKGRNNYCVLALDSFCLQIFSNYLKLSSESKNGFNCKFIQNINQRKSCQYYFLWMVYTSSLPMKRNLAHVSAGIMQKSYVRLKLGRELSDSIIITYKIYQTQWINWYHYVFRLIVVFPTGQKTGLWYHCNGYCSNSGY
jgi:hypothetical protein